MTDQNTTYEIDLRLKQLNSELDQLSGIEKLRAIMSCLRDPIYGCEWDKKQTLDSILPYTIEEVYEVAEAIERNDFNELKDELGDLLFQIVFLSQIAAEQNKFDLEQVFDAISQKLLRRHPHVFAGENVASQEQLNINWEQQKHQERLNKDLTRNSVLDDIPRALPELKRAQKIQKRVSKIGFDWESVEQVWLKVNEEEVEVKQAIASGDKSLIEEEIGDLLFAVVNLSRHCGVDAETALRKANQKFDARFRKVEKMSEASLCECSPQQLDNFWRKAKRMVSEESKSKQSN